MGSSAAAPALRYHHLHDLIHEHLAIAFLHSGLRGGAVAEGDEGASARVACRVLQQLDALYGTVGLEGGAQAVGVHKLGAHDVDAHALVLVLYVERWQTHQRDRTSVDDVLRCGRSALISFRAVKLHGAHRPVVPNVGVEDGTEFGEVRAHALGRYHAAVGRLEGDSVHATRAAKTVPLGLVS